MKNNIFIAIICLLPFYYSCDKMLEEVPTKQKDIVPDKVEYLQALLVDDSFYFNLKTIAGIGDDFKTQKELQDLNTRTYGEYRQYVYSFDIDLANELDIPDLPWNDLYEQIYTINTVLEYLPDVAGSESDKANVKGQALFLRAYNHYNIARVFALPYQKSGGNDQIMGIGIRTNTSLSDFPDRSSLEDSYEHILNDLDEAETLLENIDLVVAPNGKRRQWRASNTALYALKAKVLLEIGSFDEALIYAQKALDKKGVAALVNFHTDMDYAEDIINTRVEVMIEPNVTEVQYVKYPKTKGMDFNPYDWTETIYFRKIDTRTIGVSAIPTDELISLYGDATNRSYDLRWKYWFAENGSFVNSAFTGSMQGDTYIPPVQYTTFNGFQPTGLSLAEVYLTKAECQARTGDFNAAQITINELRANRIAEDAPESYRNLSFSSVNDAIQKIMNERRRELPFITRWFDLRRMYGYGDTDLLPNRIEREFFKYTAEEVITANPVTYVFDPVADYKKFAFPIPNTDILTLRDLGVEFPQNTY